jgi:hypothetical protein
MVLPVDLTGRTTTFQTDALAVYAPTQVIDETTVASGDVAEATWSGLKPATAYAWIVTARTSGGGTSAALPSVFVTADDRGRPVPLLPEDLMYPYFQSARSATQDADR